VKVVLSDEAKADLREIALFIARDNKTRARSFVRELRAKAHDVGDMPLAWPLIPRYAHHGIRRRPFRDYLIFYRIDEDGISIVRILHGARDYETLLFLEE
jgi:plasmid stabilization system protein ParE